MLKHGGAATREVREQMPLSAATPRTGSASPALADRGFQSRITCGVNNGAVVK
jgi:hypothetical protein